MKAITEMAPAPPPRPLWQRLAWFAGLWAASVAVIGTIAYLLRWWLHP